MEENKPWQGNGGKRVFQLPKGDEYLKNIVLWLLKYVHVAGAGKGDSIWLVLGSVAFLSRPPMRRLEMLGAAAALREGAGFVPS